MLPCLTVITTELLPMLYNVNLIVIVNTNRNTGYSILYYLILEKFKIPCNRAHVYTCMGWMCRRGVTTTRSNIFFNIFLPETTVTGPLMLVTFIFVKFFMMHCISSVFPTFGGPAIATTTGGGSNTDRSGSGTWIFFIFTSCDLGKNIGGQGEARETGEQEGVCASVVNMILLLLLVFPIIYVSFSVSVIISPFSDRTEHATLALNDCVKLLYYKC